MLVESGDVMPDSWQENMQLKPLPPHCYMRSLEEGRHESKNEWAVLHVGRHYLCHGEDRPCEMLSTTMLCSEAMRRMSDNRRFQIVCVPTDRWDDVAVDLSTKNAARQVRNFDKHCREHKVDPKVVFAHANRYKEIVLDRRGLRLKGNEGVEVFELSFKEVQELKESL